MLTKHTSNDRGVSPVVAVILMVAVTVILAAVIGTFVLDLGSNTEQNPQAGVTFNQGPSSGAGDANVTVRLISVEAADEVTVQTDGSGSVSYASGSALTDSGDTATVENANADDTVTVIGSLEGKEAVLQTYTVKG